MLILERAAPRKPHATNGAVNQTLMEDTRTMNLALEEHLRHKEPVEGPLVLWIDRHSAWREQFRS